MPEQYQYSPSQDNPFSYDPPRPEDWKRGGRYYDPNRAIARDTSQGGNPLNQELWDAEGYRQASRQYEEANKRNDSELNRTGLDPSYDPRIQAYQNRVVANAEAREGRNDKQQGSKSSELMQMLQMEREYQSQEAEKQFQRNRQLQKEAFADADKNRLTPEQQIGITAETFKRTQPYVLDRIRANNEGQIKATSIQAEASKYGSLLDYQAQMDSNAKQLEGTKYRTDSEREVGLDSNAKQLEGTLDANAKQLEGVKYSSDAQLSGSALSTMMKSYTDSMGNSVNRLANIFSIQPNANMIWRK